MELGLTGKRFLVTGGTRGIGRAVVDGLLAEGADVAFCARSSAEWSPRPRRSCPQTAAIAIGTAVDVGDATALEDWVTHSADRARRHRRRRRQRQCACIPDNAENWRTSFDVDLMGTIGLVEAALPHLLATGVGFDRHHLERVRPRDRLFAGTYGT